MSAESSGTEKFSGNMERFSQLSSELKELLLDLDQKIKSATDQLNAMQQAVDQKTSELKKLHDIDVQANTLEQLIEEQRIQKQKLEEESRAIARKNAEIQQAFEKDYLARELKLKEREAEWIRLIQELELFMTRLVQRAQPQPPATPAAPAASVSSLKEMLLSQEQRIRQLTTNEH
jgi:hypothetical protein